MKKMNIGHVSAIVTWACLFPWWLLCLLAMAGAENSYAVGEYAGYGAAITIWLGFLGVVLWLLGSILSTLRGMG